jgi:hypothetical protein
MSIDQGLGIAGIIVSVLLGVGGFLAAKTIRSKRLKQTQKVGRGGIAIQSGRETHIK